MPVTILVFLLLVCVMLVMMLMPVMPVMFVGSGRLADLQVVYIQIEGIRAVRIEYDRLEFTICFGHVDGEGDALSRAQRPFWIADETTAIDADQQLSEQFFDREIAEGLRRGVHVTTVLGHHLGGRRRYRSRTLADDQGRGWQLRRG